MEPLRKLWRHFFKYNWKFGLFLILLFGIPRFILVLHANVSGGYSIASIIFMVMWFTPFIFLTKYGRKEMGMKRPNRCWQLLPSFVIGILSCGVVFGIFYLLFPDPSVNAFAYISKAGAMPDGINDSDRFVYFIIASVPSMIFSPIGEEFFYRGVVHGSFVDRFGETRASVFDSLAFAFTHLAHFGIIYSAGVWRFLPFPSLVWVISMFFVSQVFFRCKQMCNSITGAVFAHAGFNFAMMYFIFYHII